MISKRYALLKALETSANTILLINSYNEDIREVYLGRTEFSDNEKDYFLTILEVDDHREKPIVAKCMEHHVIPFYFQGFIKEGGTNDFERAYQLLADLQKALRPEKDNLFNGLAVKVEIEPGSVIRPLEGTSAQWLFVIVRLNITIIEDFKPY